MVSLNVFGIDSATGQNKGLGSADSLVDTGGGTLIARRRMVFALASTAIPTGSAVYTPDITGTAILTEGASFATVISSGTTAGSSGTPVSKIRFDEAGDYIIKFVWELNSGSASGQRTTAIHNGSSFTVSTDSSASSAATNGEFHQFEYVDSGIVLNEEYEFLVLQISGVARTAPRGLITLTKAA